jgi:hypothetical protein
VSRAGVPDLLEEMWRALTAFDKAALKHADHDPS